MNDLLVLEQRLSALLANVTPQGRRELARKISRQLRQNQRQRIAQQQNPDGSGFEPRKPRKVRSKNT